MTGQFQFTLSATSLFQENKFRNLRVSVDSYSPRHQCVNIRYETNVNINCKRKTHAFLFSDELLCPMSNFMAERRFE